MTMTMNTTATGEALRRALDGPFHEIKQRWRNEVDGADVVRDPALSMEEARDWTLERVKDLAARHLVTAGFPAAQGGSAAQRRQGAAQPAFGLVHLQGVSSRPFLASSSEV